MPPTAAVPRTSILLGDVTTPPQVRTRPNAPAAEEFAAEELRRHLQQMLGLGPQLRRRERDTGAPAIVVNDAEVAAAAGVNVAALALGPEAFRLESRGNRLFVLGGGPRGVLYGVYELLERLGCRWFTPEVNHVPRRERLALPGLSLTQRPAFEFRDTFNWDCGDPLWWVRNRMNGWYTPVPEYMGGHMTYGLFVHTFDRLVPPEEFFAAHPEYFSQINGVRRKESSQLCLSNPAVLRIVTERVLELMRTLPRATIFSVSQNDCTGYCECPACAAIAEAEGSQSGPILRFVNAVAAATVKPFPDRLIDTLAYWYSLDAPKLTKPHPNVRVRLCPIRCCQGHAFGRCDHPESTRFLKALQGWSKLTPQMYIWHYCTNFANYPLPMPDFDEIHANIGLYRRFGVYGVFMQGMGENGGGAESMPLRGWLISRLLWNPEQPVWPLVDEFLPAVYGRAAPGVRRYLDVFHEAVRRDPHLHPSLYDPPTHPLFDPARTRPATAALAGAERLVRGTERQRVRLLRNGLEYARLCRRSGLYRLRGHSFRGNAPAGDARLLRRLVAGWQAAGVQHLREGAPLAFTAQVLRNRLVPHPVVWLRRGPDALAVVPALGGRALEWHAAGRQWLAPPDPDNAWTPYPMSEGYAEFAIPGMYTYLGWAETYNCRRRAGMLALAADVGSGLRLHRTFTLAANELRIVSRLENTGRAPVRSAWGGGLHLLVPENAVLAFAAAAGEVRIDTATMKDGLGEAMVFEGARCPQGAWAVTLPGGLRLEHRFAGHPLQRAVAGRVAARGILALDLRTDTEAIAPGAALEVRQTVKVVPPA